MDRHAGQLLAQHLALAAMETRPHLDAHLPHGVLVADPGEVIGAGKLHEPGSRNVFGDVPPFFHP